MKHHLALAATAALVLGSGFVPVAAHATPGHEFPEPTPPGYEEAPKLFPGAEPFLTNGKKCADTVNDIALPKFILDEQSNTVGYYTVAESMVSEPGDSFTVQIGVLGSLPYPAKLYYAIDPDQTPYNTLYWYFANCAFVPVVEEPVAEEPVAEPETVPTPVVPVPAVSSPSAQPAVAPADSYVAPPVAAPPIAVAAPSAVVEPPRNAGLNFDTGAVLPETGLQKQIMTVWAFLGFIAVVTGAGLLRVAKKRFNS